MSGSINEAEAARPQRRPSAFLLSSGPLLVALAALPALVLTLDGVGESDRQGWDAPGLTLDEIFNLDQGEYLWHALLTEGPAWFTPQGASRIFAPPRYNPDHPPLGRLWLGGVHAVFRPTTAHPPHQPPPVVYQLFAARMASVLAFLATLLLVGWAAGRWYGRLAGTAAAAACVLMPRLFGHAHLAALESSLGLIFTATVLYVAAAFPAPPPPPEGANETSREGVGEPPGIARRPPPWRAVLLGGVLFGLALLTKIQAVLLPAPLLLWALWQYRWQAVPRMLVFGCVGGGVFFLGWPWLWLDPIEHLREYFGGKAVRPTLYCYYLGRRYADVAVPWHYPFVMFLTTVPVGLHALAVRGLWTGRSTRGTTPAPRRDPRGALVAGVVLFVLSFFALPGVTNYDGERLFLVVYPLWGVLIGRGAAAGWSSFAAADWRAWVTPALFVLGVGEGLWGHFRLHPCQLSFYNVLVGGLAGADRLGFERSYWRDSFTRRFLSDVVAAVPRGSTLYVAPVLHPANRIDLLLLSPLLQQRRLNLDAYDDQDPAKRSMRYVLVFRRRADPWPALEPAPRGGRLLAEVVREGVQLAALYELAPSPE